MTKWDFSHLDENSRLSQYSEINQQNQLYPKGREEKPYDCIN